MTYIFDLDEYLLESSYYEFDEVLVNGVVTTGDIVVSEKQVVIIRCNYISVE